MDTNGEEVFEPRLEELVIEPSLTAGIESLARSVGTGMGLVMLVCYCILLWWHTGEAEVEIGTEFDGRCAAEVEESLGLFARYLPVTCRVEEGLQFNDFIERINESFLTVRDWQEYFSWSDLGEVSGREQVFIVLR